MSSRDIKYEADRITASPLTVLAWDQIRAVIRQVNIKIVLKVLLLSLAAPSPTKQAPGELLVSDPEAHDGEEGDGDEDDGTADPNKDPQDWGDDQSCLQRADFRLIELRV